MKHKIGWGAILIAVLCAPMAFAQSYTDNLREGRDYILLDPPLPTRVSKGKIEVIEFFNFSCPYCFRMQGPFLRWMEENADNLKDVEIVYQPVPFQSAGGHYARAFHTMQALKVAKAFRGKFFNAIHRKRVLLNSQSRLVGWLGSLGLDVDRADKVYESFSVNSKLKRDERLIKAYGVNSTPQMSVAGKYVLSRVSTVRWKACWVLCCGWLNANAKLCKKNWQNRGRQPILNLPHRRPPLPNKHYAHAQNPIYRLTRRSIGGGY